MKKPLYYILFSVIVIIFQFNIRLFFPSMIIIPDLLLIFVVFSALISGVRAGLITGFMIGLIQDIFLGGMVGVYTIIKTIIGGIAGFSEGKIYKRNVIIPPILVFILSILQEIFLLVFSEKLLFNINFFNLLKTNIFPFSIYNMIISLVLYIIIYFVLYNGRNYYE